MATVKADLALAHGLLGVGPNLVARVRELEQAMNYLVSCPPHNGSYYRPVSTICSHSTILSQPNPKQRALTW